MTDTDEKSTHLPVSDTLPIHNPLRRLLGSARMFSNAVTDVFERQIQLEFGGNRLSASQWKLLTVLATTKVNNVSEVAAYQGVSTAAASKAVQRLTRMRLVTRMVDPRDRRHVRLTLSDDGARLTAAYLAKLDRSLAELPGDAEAEGLAAISRMLDQYTVAVLRVATDPSAICIQCGLNGWAGCLMRDALRRDCHLRSHRREFDPGLSHTKAARPEIPPPIE